MAALNMKQTINFSVRVKTGDRLRIGVVLGSDGYSSPNDPFEIPLYSDVKVYFKKNGKLVSLNLLCFSKLLKITFFSVDIF